MKPSVLRGMGCIAAVMTMLAACGGSADDASAQKVSLETDVGGLPSADLPLDPPPGTSPTAAAALATWRDLPVDAQRRPIVLSGSDAYTGTNYTGISGLRFADPAQVPQGPVEADGYPLIDARAALAVIHRDTKQFPRSSKRAVVTEVTFGSARFWTDRGLQRLPAWIIKFRLPKPTNGTYYLRYTETAHVLAVGPSARFGPVNRDGAGARVTDDGMTILVPRGLQGHKSGPCRKVFTTGVVETRGAVAFRITERRVDPAAKCPEKNLDVRTLETAVAVVHLSHPLGNRVVTWEQSGAFPWPIFACAQKTDGYVRYPYSPVIPECDAQSAGNSNPVR